MGNVGSILELGKYPEKGTATHSSILAWRIPWTEEPGLLQSMGLQRVGHNRTTNTFSADKLEPKIPSQNWGYAGVEGRLKREGIHAQL